MEDDFEERELAETDYRVLVEVPEESEGTSAHILRRHRGRGIVKLPDELLPHSKQVGEALMKVTPRLRT